MDCLKPHEKLLVLSPHLDDAVFSCGTLIAACPEATVVTVFAGIPPQPEKLTDWDKISGFNSALQAMHERRAEDRRAMEILAAHPVWLDFLDAQYGAWYSDEELSANLQKVVSRFSPTHVAFPAGLFHSDHEAVHRAAWRVYRHSAELSWWMYEDALYRCIPGLLQQRLSKLFEKNVHATHLSFFNPTASELKCRACACYASQLRALRQRASAVNDLSRPERYWRLGSPTENIDESDS